MKPEFSEEEFRLFSEWLVQKFGLRFGPEKRDILRARLEPRRAELGFESYEQLFFHLKFHPDRAAERNRLLPHLTNNESYFFRERPQLEVFRSEILPAVRERLIPTGRREVRVLSAGCAAGEEPYTLAMIAHESGLFVDPWRVRITGMDVDVNALDRARAARYTAHAFRGVDDAVRTQYFDADQDRWILKEPVRSIVEFHQANLVDPCWPANLPPQDVIFCRNVLIYFDDAGISRVAEAFYRALVPGGYLFLGHAESLSRIPTRFETIRQPGAVFYCRPDEDE